jgi:hypothetical protein
MVYEWLEFVEDLPEYCHYQDEGCDFYYSCLNCPFPYCVLDLPAGEQFIVKQWRNAEIIRRFNSRSTIPELSRAFHMSQSSIYRILNLP